MDAAVNIEQGYAIVGTALRCPGASSLEEFWQLLVSGRETHTHLPHDRFIPSRRPSNHNGTQSQSTPLWGSFLDHVDQFDARLFNISPREAAQMDPAQRLILLTAFEALESAGYSRDRTPSTHHSRIGTFYGLTGDDYREANAAVNIDFAYVTGGVRAFGPGRINFHFKLDGPSYSVDTACSASAASIQLAISSLKAGDCDTAIAGGANVLTDENMFAGLTRGGFLSPTGSCKTFLESADGYCRGEAVGCVVIKRLSDAVADNDNIMAVIRSCATNHSSRASSIVQPHSETQETLYRKVLSDAQLRPQDVGHVEMHGTGTRLGDAVESRSVSNVFLNDVRTAQEPLHVGTLKPNIGHGEAASGVCSLIKSMLILENGLIPPLVNADKTLNPALPQRFMNAIPREPTPFLGTQRRILVSNFGAAGSNTAMVVEDPPPVVTKQTDPRPYTILSVSAKTVVSLKRNLERLSGFVRDNPLAVLADIGYTTTARRLHHPLRLSFTCSTREGAIDMMTTALSSVDQAVPARRPPLVFVFQGQGNVPLDRAPDISALSSSFLSSLERSVQVCISLGFPSIRGPLFHAAGDYDVVQMQLALVAFEVALYDMWLSWNVEPIAVVGHSIGEYPALYAAGILDLSGMFLLIGSRASLMQSRCIKESHEMLAVHTDSNTCLSLILDQQLSGLEIACYNGSSTVISGPVKDLGALKVQATNRGLRTTSLSLPYAFHSAQMDCILEDIVAISRKVSSNPALIPVASTVTGGMIQKGQTVPPDYFSRQTRDPVLFSQAVKQLSATFGKSESPAWLSVGPSDASSSMLKGILIAQHTKLMKSLGKAQPPWESLTHTVSTMHQMGLDIDWSEFHKDYEKYLTLVRLPSYAFDMRSCWLPHPSLVQNSESQRTGSRAIATPRYDGRLPLAVPQDLARRDCNATCSSSFTVIRHDDYLRPLVTGHRINGNALCSSSTYADMAYAVLSSASPSGNRVASKFSLDNMSISKPFILRDRDSQQSLRVHAQARVTAEGFDLEFTSGGDGSAISHAKCTATPANCDQWRASWYRLVPLVHSRITSIQGHEPCGYSSVLGNRMIYKLFQNVVDYSAKYRGLEKVWLSTNFGEAVGISRFQTRPEECDGYHCCPYWIESILHISGFALNASDQLSADTVYIAHGWSSLKIVENLKCEEAYTCYVHMVPEQRTKSDTMVGDVYALNQTGAVALVCEGIRFQAIKRTLLDKLVPAQEIYCPSSASGLPKGASGPRVETHAASGAPEPADQFAVFTPSTPSTDASYSAGNEAVASFDTVLKIISEETGVELAALTAHTYFADIGVDSLMSFPVVQRLHEQGLPDLPHDIFLKYSTVKDLRRYLSVDVEGPRTSAGRCESEERYVKSQEPSNVQEAAKAVIAEELGVELADMTLSASLSDFGMDSLMSMAVADAFGSKLGMQVSSSLLQETASLGDLLQRLSPSDCQSTSKSQQRIKHQSKTVRFGSSPSRRTRSLFLLPDGSGSAASYGPLGQFISQATVYALDSPFKMTALEFECSIQQASELYVQAIRKAQPVGPYTLGGWSVGGAYAVECARQLTSQGETVDSLILIDAPCFTHVPPMSTNAVDMLKRIGVFGLQELSERTEQHFAATMRALATYRPQSIESSARVTCIWGRSGVLETRRACSDAQKQLDEAGHPGVAWLLHPRSAADGARTGWADLLRGAPLAHVDVDGDHFSMMRSPHVEGLARAVNEALALTA